MNQLSYLIDEAFEKFSDLYFIKERDENDCLKTFKYKEILDLIKIVEGNIGNNFVPDMKIIVLDSNNHRYVALVLACISCNITYIPVDTSLSEDSLLAIIKDTKATHIYVGECFFDRYEIFLKNEKICVLGNEIFDNSDIGEKVLVEQDNAVILYTSGSTGNFKGVALKYRNLYHNLLSFSKGIGLKENTIFYNTLPFFHSYATMTDLLYNIYMGNCVCIGNVMKKMVSDLECFKPDYIFTVPLIARKIIDAPKINSNLKGVICGGAKVSEELVAKYMNKNIEFLVGYGITECSPVVSVMKSGILYTEEKCVGHILDCNEVLISDGELLIKGENVVNEYFNNSELSKISFCQGYFKTGDMGFIKDGKLFIDGRKKDVLSLENGKNLHPDSIESFFDEKEHVFKSLLFLDEENNKMKLSLILFIDSNLKYNELKNMLNDYVLTLNSQVKIYEKIKQVYFIPSEFIELTSTNKLKRNLDLLYKDKACIYEFIIGAIEQILDIELPACSSNIKLIEDLDLDSFDYINLIVEIESKFNILIKETELYKISSVKDLVELVFYKKKNDLN